MEHALVTLNVWMAEGRPLLWLALAVGVALCFVVFNGLRILLYLPQLRTCLQDGEGCRAINLWTWSSWIVANLSTALYMLIFLGDRWGALLNAGNALMCSAVVGITLFKRHRLGGVRTPPELEPVA